MKRTRAFLLLVFLVAGVVAGAIVWRAWSAKNEARATAAGYERKQAETTARMAALEAQIEASAQRAQAVEADNALLKEALAQAQAAQAVRMAKAVPTAAPLTRQEVEARFKQARELARNGDPAEALRALLWCWDEGVKRLSAGVNTAQWSGVMTALAELAKRYPPAGEVLRERRDALRQRVLAGPGGRDAVQDYAGVLRALGEENAIIDLFADIPKGDRRRSTLAIFGSQQLVEAKRYDLAMEGPDAVQMLSTFEMMRNTPPAATSRGGEPSPVVRSALQNIEILTGAGDLPHARELADRLLAFDNSDSTKALIQQRAERAGHPELLANRAP